MKDFIVGLAGADGTESAVFARTPQVAAKQWAMDVYRRDPAFALEVMRAPDPVLVSVRELFKDGPATELRLRVRIDPVFWTEGAP